MTEPLQIEKCVTTFTLSPAASDEREFCYSSTDPIDNACVGHLRGDFDRSGTAFFTSWWPHHDELKTDLFVIELEDVINGLRDNGLLKDLKSMTRQCYSCPDAEIKDEYCFQAAFRITTDHHLFFLRCIPNKGDYNFYCYGYDRAKFDAIRQRQKQQEQPRNTAFSTRKRSVKKREER